MKDTVFSGSSNGEIYYLSKSFTDLNKDNRRGILKTAKSLLKVQKADKAVIAEVPFLETGRLA